MINDYLVRVKIPTIKIIDNHIRIYIGYLFDVKNPKSFEGSNIKDVDSYLDDVLNGFEKQPLKNGEGVRYFDGKGNSWQLNYGYENATDAIHGGAYLKTTVGSDKIRIPLSK